MKARIILALILLMCTPIHAARIEMTGFESGSNIECTSGSGGSPTVPTAPVYSGTYALLTNASGTATAYCSIGIISATGVPATGGGSGTLYTVFRYRIAFLPASAQEDIFVAEGTSSSFKMYVRLTSTGKLQVYDSTNTKMGSDGTTTLAIDTWYLIGVKVGTGASAAYEVQLNGVTELSGTGNLSTNGHSVRSFGKRTNTSGVTMAQYYDDISVDDAAFPVGNSIIALHPNANGSTMQWSAGTGSSDYTQIDEVVPVTTDYVQSVAQNNIALFRFETLSASYTTPIPTVKSLMRVAESVSTSTSISLRIRSGSTNADLTAADVGNTSYATRAQLRETDPNGSVAWSVAAVNAVEAGVIDLQSAGSRPRLAWIALMVEAAPVGAAPPATRTRISTY